MVVFWEVCGGYGGVAVEEGILSLFSPWTSQASLISLFLSINNSVSLFISRGKKITFNAGLLFTLNRHVFNF